jgi:hypothetical protein
MFWKMAFERPLTTILFTWVVGGVAIRAVDPITGYEERPRNPQPGQRKIKKKKVAKR